MKPAVGSVVRIVFPDGMERRARYDGDQDARTVGLGWLPLVTVLEPGPGLAVGSTFTTRTLRRHGLAVWWSVEVAL